jgi:hypothetical protein
MQNRKLLAVGVLAGLGLVACQTSGTNPLTPPNQANVNNDVLQLAVGTANVAGQAAPGLNVFTTFRQPNGQSAVFVSTPAFTGPFTLPSTAGTPDTFSSTIETGPAPAEVGTATMTGTPQTGTAASTFGISGGVFGVGIEPFNYNQSGAPSNVAPYVLPLYDPVADDPNAFLSWGGPPAFDLLGNGQSPVGSTNEPGGTAGISEGIDVFAQLAPVAGKYTLSATVNGNTGIVTKTASTSLASTALLAAISAPAAPTVDGNGGATFAVTLPAGVTEAYLQILDVGPAKNSSCNTASPSAPIYYTIELTASGPATLADAIGPGAAPSLCTPAQNTAKNSTSTTTVTTDGDSFTVQLIGFDYPLYEASYRNQAAVNGASASPKLAGANGQADITISTVANYTWPNGNAAPSTAARSAAAGLRSRGR